MLYIKWKEAIGVHGVARISLPRRRYHQVSREMRKKGLRTYAESTVWSESFIVKCGIIGLSAFIEALG